MYALRPQYPPSAGGRERISYTPEVEEEIAEAEAPFSLKDWWWAALSLVLLVLMAVLLVRYVRAGK